MARKLPCGFAGFKNVLPMNKLSVIVPVFNEAENIRPLCDKLMEVFRQQGISDHEILFVDDGSTDVSLEVIRELSATAKGVRGLSLTRNFGQQMALYAGMEHAKGDVVITMDADLQHPPGLIPELISAYRAGYDLVNTRRRDAPGTGFFKKASSRVFYRLMNFLSEVPIEAASSDFRLMSRRAVDAFLKMPERNRFTRGMVGWMGFPQTFVDYRAGIRQAGKSKYTLKKMMGFALDGITSFSARPLRLISLSGVVVFLLGMVYAVYAVVQHFLGHTVSGWTSLMVSVWILGGIQLLAIGLISEYILRIFAESKQRPHYLIREQTGG